MAKIFQNEIKQTEIIEPRSITPNLDTTSRRIWDTTNMNMSALLRHPLIPLHFISAGDPVMINSDSSVQEQAGTVQIAYSNTSDINNYFAGITVKNIYEEAKSQVSLRGGLINDLSGLTRGSVYYIQDLGGSTVDVDLSNTSTNNRGMVVGEENWQSFKVGSNYTYLDRLEGYGGRSAGPDTITYTIRVYREEGIDGVKVFEKTGLTTWGGTSNAFFDLLPTGEFIPVTAGRTYTWSIETTAISGTHNLRYDTGNPYADGRSNVGSGSDYIFKTYGKVHTSTVGTSPGTNSKIIGVAQSETSIVTTVS